MSKAQRDKGKRGERMLSQLLRDIGFPEARRTSQYCGRTGDASDVIGVEGLHIECKFVEKLNIHAAMRQAENDCKDTDKIPVVVCKRSGEPWYAFLPAIDFFQMVKERNG